MQRIDVPAGGRVWAFPGATVVMAASTDRSHLHLVGEIESSIRDELVAELVPVVRAAGRPLVVDSTGVRFIDSAGTAALVALARAAGGGELRARESQRFLFDIVGIDQVMSVSYAAPA